jgi:hypothetical protein
MVARLALLNRPTRHIRAGWVLEATAAPRRGTVSRLIPVIAFREAAARPVNRHGISLPRGLPVTGCA